MLLLALGALWPGELLHSGQSIKSSSGIMEGMTAAINLPYSRALAPLWNIFETLCLTEPLSAAMPESFNPQKTAFYQILYPKAE